MGDRDKCWNEYIELYRPPPAVLTPDEVRARTHAGPGSAFADARGGGSASGAASAVATDFRPLAPARTDLSSKHKYAIVEICCGPESLIGCTAAVDCKVFRITVGEDMTSGAGVRWALRWVRHLRTRMPGLLWLSIPCTGGSIRNAMNPVRHTPEFQTRLKQLRATAKKMWQNVERIAGAVMSCNWGRLSGLFRAHTGNGLL